jgi:hypothetical protein
MNVRLHIDRLVVDGIALGPAAGRRLQAAVESELTRLITANGLGHPAHGAAVPSLRAGAIPLDPNPARLGAHIARVVYQGLKNPGGS